MAGTEGRRGRVRIGRWRPLRRRLHGAARRGRRRKKFGARTAAAVVAAAAVTAVAVAVVTTVAMARRASDGQNDEARLEVAGGDASVLSGRLSA